MTSPSLRALTIFNAGFPLRPLLGGAIGIGYSCCVMDGSGARHRRILYRDSCLCLHAAQPVSHQRTQAPGSRLLNESADFLHSVHNREDGNFLGILLALCLLVLAGDRISEPRCRVWSRCGASTILSMLGGELAFIAALLGPDPFSAVAEDGLDLIDWRLAPTPLHRILDPGAGTVVWPESQKREASPAMTHNGA